MQRIRTAPYLLQSIGAAVCVFALVMTLGCPLPLSVCVCSVSLRAFSVFHVHTSASDQPGRPHCSSYAPPPFCRAGVSTEGTDEARQGGNRLLFFLNSLLSPPRETSSPGGGVWRGVEVMAALLEGDL